MKHAREFGNSDDAVAGQIGDRGLADDRREMVLAMRLERYVPEQHDLVISADFLEGAAEMMRGVFLISPRIFAPGPRHPGGGIEQPLACWIVASPANQRPDRFLHIFGNLDFGEAPDQVAIFRSAFHARPIHGPGRLAKAIAIDAAGRSRIAGVTDYGHGIASEPAGSEP